jgi:hypothetical protein
MQQYLRWHRKAGCIFAGPTSLCTAPNRGCICVLPGIDTESGLDLLDELRGLKKRQGLELLDNLWNVWPQLAVPLLRCQIRISTPITSATAPLAWAATLLAWTGRGAALKGAAQGLAAEMLLFAAIIFMLLLIGRCLRVCTRSLRASQSQSCSARVRVLGFFFSDSFL